MMRRMRFSIAGLMGFVLVAALGFGGLKAADETWASGCYSLLVTALILAVLTAIQSRGKNRAYWAGFAIAGGVYFGVVFGAIGPFRVTAPQFLTELLFDRLEAMIHPTITVAGSFTFTATTSTPTGATVPGTPPIPAPAVALTGSIDTTNTLVLSAPVSAPSIAMASPVSTPFLMMPPTNMSRVHFSQVAHSLMGLLVGMLGGFYSAWLFARRERREAEPAPGVSPSSP